MSASVSERPHTPSGERLLGASERFAAAVASGDPDACCVWFDPDAMLKLLDRPVANGRGDIAAVVADIWGSSQLRLELHPADIASTTEPGRFREMGVFSLEMIQQERTLLIERTYTIVWNIGADTQPSIAFARFD